jgi:hypothetical protein
MTTILNLTRSTHFTLHSGLVRPLDSSPGDIPKARYGSLVCVFDRKDDRLLYQLEPNDPIPSVGRLGLRFGFLGGTEFKVFAVSRLSKTFLFQTDFTFDDIKIPTVIFETRIGIKEPAADIAVAIVEGEDPLRDLCNSIKSSLDSKSRQIRFENTDRLEQFLDEFDAAVRGMKEENRYLKLECIDIQYNIRQFFKETLEKIQKKELMDMRLETIRKFRDKILSEHSEIEDIQQILDLVPLGTTGTDEFILNIISRRARSEITNENERTRALSPSSTVSDSTEDEKREKDETTQAKRKRRWRGHTNSIKHPNDISDTTNIESNLE